MSIGAQKTIGKNPRSTLYGSYGVFCDMTIFIFSKPRRGEGWAFVVTLMRILRTKSGQERQSVRMEPHPPYICKSALEARHWGATYALYRVRILSSYFATQRREIDRVFSTSFAMVSSSIVFFHPVLVSIGLSWQLNIRRHLRTRNGCTRLIRLPRVSRSKTVRRRPPRRRQRSSRPPHVLFHE